MSKPIEPQLREALDILDDVVWQTCITDGKLDSMAESAYAGAIRLLAKYDYVSIIVDYGRRVIAEPIIEQEDAQVGPP